MIVLTCISDTEHNGYLWGLKKSCIHHNLELKTIIHQGAWSSHRIKDEIIQKFLTELNPQEVVLFTDGYDAILTSSEGEINEKYSAFDSPIIFSSERNCYPYANFSFLYKKCDSPFKYLNSGGYIGRAGDILELYDSLKEIDYRQPLAPDRQNQWSNQYHWMKVYLFTNNSIKLDTECSIFQTIASDLSFRPNFDENGETNSETVKSELIERERRRSLSDFEFSTNRFFNRVTQSTPCHIHFTSIYLKDFMFSSKMRSVVPWMDEYDLDQNIQSLVKA